MKNIHTESNVPSFDIVRKYLGEVVEIPLLSSEQEFLMTKKIKQMKEQLDAKY